MFLQIAVDIVQPYIFRFRLRFHTLVEAGHFFVDFAEFDFIVTLDFRGFLYLVREVFQRVRHRAWIILIVVLFKPNFLLFDLILH